jgi:hypothetical protein
VITTRVLPKSEWPSLLNTWIADVPLESLGAEVVAVERDGVLVGVWPIASFLHADACWIHPDHRGNPAIAKALITGVQSEAFARGASVLLMGSESDQIDDYIQRLGGVRIPGKTFVVRV